MGKKLRDYELPHAEVVIDAKNSFDIYGLSFEDLTNLSAAHMPILSMMFEKFMDEKNQKDGLTPEAVQKLIFVAAKEFPETLAHIIALAAGEPGEVAKVGKLPFPVQADAVEKIIDLTFRGEAEVKKLVETVTRILNKFTASLQAVTTVQPSGNGNGAFASR